MSDVMCCAKCGHALRIVCPEHGDGFVPDRRMEPAPERPPERAKKAPKPESRRGQILAALHPTEPRRAADIAAVIGGDAKVIGIELCQMRHEGHVQRVRHGEYVRATP